MTIKYVRLNKAERDSIATKFKEPLYAAALAKKVAGEIPTGRAVYEAAFPAEVRAVLPVLEKHGFTVGLCNLYVSNEQEYGGQRIQFGGKTYPGLSTHITRQVPKPILAAAEEVQRVYSAEIREIDKLTAGVYAASLAMKTRFEFGQAWSALYTVMGKDWVEARADVPPGNLPVVVNLEGATAALLALKETTHG